MTTATIKLSQWFCRKFYLLTSFFVLLPYRNTIHISGCRNFLNFLHSQNETNEHPNVIIHEWRDRPRERERKTERKRVSKKENTHHQSSKQFYLFIERYFFFSVWNSVWSRFYSFVCSGEFLVWFQLYIGQRYW